MNCWSNMTSCSRPDHPRWIGLPVKTLEEQTQAEEEQAEEEQAEEEQAEAEQTKCGSVGRPTQLPSHNLTAHRGSGMSGGVPDHLWRPGHQWTGLPVMEMETVLEEAEVDSLTG